MDTSAHITAMILLVLGLLIFTAGVTGVFHAGSRALGFVPGQPACVSAVCRVAWPWE